MGKLNFTAAWHC